MGCEFTTGFETIHVKLRQKIKEKMKFYKTMVVPLLVYGSEVRVPNKKISCIEIFLRKTIGCTELNHMQNELQINNNNILINPRL